MARGEEHAVDDRRVYHQLGATALCRRWSEKPLSQTTLFRNFPLQIKPRQIGNAMRPDHGEGGNAEDIEQAIAVSGKTPA